MLDYSVRSSLGRRRELLPAIALVVAIAKSSTSTRHDRYTIDTDTKAYDNTRPKNKAADTIITRSTCLASSLVGIHLFCAVVKWLDVPDVVTGRQQQQERKGPGLLTNLEVTLADMYRGKTAEVRAIHPFPTSATTQLLTPCSLNYLARYYAIIVEAQEQHRTGTSCNAPLVVVKA